MLKIHNVLCYFYHADKVPGFKLIKLSDGVSVLLYALLCCLFLLFYIQVMIYLIDKVLPESYFANNLRALSGKHKDTNNFTHLETR